MGMRKVNSCQFFEHLHTIVSQEETARGGEEVMRKPLYLVGDFETTVYKGQDHTEVWASAVVPVGSEEVQTSLPQNRQRGKRCGVVAQGKDEEQLFQVFRLRYGSMVHHHHQGE